MLAEARAAIDPDGFQNLDPHAQHAAGWARSDALNKLTWIVIRKGGLVRDITVGDCFELTTALQGHHFRGSAGRPLFYAMLKKAGVFPRRGARAVEGAAAGRSAQRRANRRRLRDRVSTCPGSAGRVPHRAIPRDRPHLAALRCLRAVEM
jgi:hypothetical protein